MEVVHQRAEQIRDGLWRIRNVNKGKAMLDEYDPLENNIDVERT
jgi:hypothetical protein